MAISSTQGTGNNVALARGRVEAAFSESGQLDAESDKLQSLKIYLDYKAAQRTAVNKASSSAAGAVQG
jgi:hypothetical protein